MTDQFKRGNLSARFRQMAADQPRKTAAMTDQTQILDVPYGMFSCRLEGFDDSVATMKQIVSYFHDLAGHEAFMGDALLAPDMEEVSRLAGASSRGDVEAAMAGGKLHLRLRDTQHARLASLSLREAHGVGARLWCWQFVVGRPHLLGAQPHEVGGCGPAPLVWRRGAPGCVYTHAVRKCVCARALTRAHARAWRVGMCVCARAGVCVRARERERERARARKRGRERARGAAGRVR